MWLRPNLKAMMYQQCAPLFFNHDRFILHLTEEQHNDTLKLYDLHSQRDTILYQSSSPIIHYLLRDAHTLLWCCDVHKTLRWHELNLHHPEIPPVDKTEAFKHVHRLSIRRKTFLPHSEGILHWTRICGRPENICWFQIIKTTPYGQEILEDHVEYVPSHLSMSQREHYLSYATEEGMFIKQLETGREWGVPEEKKVYLSHWNPHDMLLVCSKKKKYFLVINPSTRTTQKVCIPPLFRDGKVSFAKLSPQGDLILYAIRQKTYTAYSTSLLLQPAEGESYTMIAQKATICDIRWSENGQYISIAGINTRGDPFNLYYDHHMRKGTRYHKEIRELNGNIIWKG
jgi:hypothetical protein